jgi:hypothetical protein
MCRLIAVGCLVLIGLPLLCGGALLIGLYTSSSRLVGTLPQAPVSVDGDCPRDAVLAYAEPDLARRIQRILEPMDKFGEGESPAKRREQILAIDVAAMRAERDAVLAEPVPPCLLDLRATEVSLADLVIRVVDHMQTELRDGTRFRWSWAAAVSAVAMVRGVRAHMERLKSGWAALGERLGIDFEAPRESPSSRIPSQQGEASAGHPVGETEVWAAHASPLPM